MGMNQGINRLSKGVARKLTKSELARGYLFISNDQKVKGLPLIEIVVNGESLGKKKIDNSGRIGIGKNIVLKIGNKECSFLLKESRLLLSF